MIFDIDSFIYGLLAGSMVGSILASITMRVIIMRKIKEYTR